MKKLIVVIIGLAALLGLNSFKLQLDPKPVKVHQRFSIPVLMYHHVAPVAQRQTSLEIDLTVLASDFEEQLQWLKSHGYTSITTKNLADAFSGDYILPRKPVILTFDDGYMDVFEYAVPLLKKYEMTGSFAVITGFVGTRNYAEWADIKKALDQGMEIVSHSYSHSDLPKKNLEEIEYELTRSNNDLMQYLGVTTTTFIYPYGHYNKLAMDLLNKHGFRIAFTTKSGLVNQKSSMLELPRVRVHGEQSIKRFEAKLKGVISE